ncbi:MAG: hypothetical protein ACLSAP_03805 [Oscillospiraceae bacterium]
MYKAYCKEGFDENGILHTFEVQYPENYNFGYDIVDEIAKLDPERRAIVWCNVEGENAYSRLRICELSNKAANVLRAWESAKAIW